MATTETCILCGSKPPLTGEHLWPDWYNNQQPPTRKYTLERTVEGTTTAHGSRAMSVKPRVLCRLRKCNEKWGSQLENRVGPILTPMIRGEQAWLDRRAVQLVASWFFLKAMVSEYLEAKPTPIFTIEQGRHLRALLQPPKEIRIWIGHYVGVKSADAGRVSDRTATTVISEDPPASAVWIAITYTIGQVALQAHFSPGVIMGVGHSPPRGAVGYWLAADSPGSWNDALIKMWPSPVVPLSWPPKQAFDDNGFERLANRWKQ